MMLKLDGKEKGGRGRRTCIMPVRTLGTSLKKKSAKMPATVPKEAAVSPLIRRGLG